jgi:hypothetical protein
MKKPRKRMNAGLQHVRHPRGSKAKSSLGPEVASDGHCVMPRSQRAGSQNVPRKAPPLRAGQRHGKRSITPNEKRRR